jgi:hypothetical protein
MQMPGTLTEREQMAIDITSESTHEEITAAVDSIIEDRKGDAALMAEERDKPVGDLTAEDNASEEPVEDTASDGEDTGEGQKPEWLDDDFLAEITAYGIDEKALADFTSREEVERAMRFFDKTALEAGRKAMADTPKRDESGRFQKEEEAEAPAPSYEISLSKDIYDEDLVDELTRMRDHYESRLSVLERRQAQNDAQAEEQMFDSIVDGMGHADLFGTSGKENPKQLQRRQDLMIAAKAQQIGMKVIGKEVNLDQALVNRVARMVFAEDFQKKDLKSATRKITKQSNGRMGGGATRPSDPAESVREEFRRRYKELEGA